MGVRIHELAKEVGLSSKEVIDFINSRKQSYGLEVKSASNSIANLYADMIKEDIAKSKSSEPPAEKIPEEKPAAEAEPKASAEDSPKAAEQAPAPEAPKPAEKIQEEKN